MEPKKRLVDAERFKRILQNTERHLKGFGQHKKDELIESIIKNLDLQPTVDAVEVVQFNTLKSLVNGEWVDCKLVQEALGIDFGTGLKMFDFSRTAEWNPAPLNGQKITTKFRLKNAVVHGRWIETLVPDGYVQKASRLRKKCSVCGWTNACRYRYCPNCGAKMDGGAEA